MKSIMQTVASRSKAYRIGKAERRQAVGFAIALLAGLGATPASASDQTGKVTSVAMAGDRVLFWMDGTRTGTRPSCDCCTRWEINVSDANGQAKMSLIMTAYAQGKTILLAGTGTCVAGPFDTEGVNYMAAL